MDTFQLSLGYRSLLPALCPPEKQAIERLSEEALLQLAKDSFDANLAEVLRSMGRWHWKLEIREIAEDIAETLSFGEQVRYERERSALLQYYTEQYRRPSAREYRACNDHHDRHPTLFARVFTSIWNEPGLLDVLLSNVRHELSRESSRMDIADVVLTILEEDVPLLKGLSLREELAIEPLVEFLVAWVGRVPLDPEYLEQNGFEPKLLEPKVTASCHSDDHVVEVKRFDATLWFAQASDDELWALREENYGGDYAADSVAEFIVAYDPQVQAMFAHNDLLPGSAELRGFECYVYEQEAEAWIAQHRPNLLAEQEEENPAQ